MLHPMNDVDHVLWRCGGGDDSDGLDADVEAGNGLMRRWWWCSWW